MDEAKIRLLILQMTRLLVTYEMELTAYHITVSAVDQKSTVAGKPFKAMESVVRLLSNQELCREARALYEPLSGLRDSITPQALDASLASMQNLIARRNNEPSIDP